MVDRRRFLKLIGMAPAALAAGAVAPRALPGLRVMATFAGVQLGEGLSAGQIGFEQGTWVSPKEYAAAEAFFGEEARLVDTGIRLKIAPLPAGTVAEVVEQEGKPMGETSSALNDIAARRVAMDALRRTSGSALQALPLFLAALQRNPEWIDAVALEFLHDLAWRGDTWRDDTDAIADDGDGA